MKHHRCHHYHYDNYRYIIMTCIIIIIFIIVALIFIVIIIIILVECNIDDCGMCRDPPPYCSDCSMGYAATLDRYTCDRECLHAQDRLFNILLHSPYGRHLLAIKGCAKGLSVTYEKSGNSHKSREPTMHSYMRRSSSILRPTNH